MSLSSSESIQVLAKCIQHIIYSNPNQKMPSTALLIKLQDIIQNEDSNTTNEVFEVDESASNPPPEITQPVEPVVEVTEVATAPVNKVKRKTKAALEKEARLAAEALAKAQAEAQTKSVVASQPVAVPVSEPKPVASASTSATDPWKTHSSRLQKIDESLCVARRIDVNNPLPGTRRNDEGANNGMVFPEKQCTRKPAPGSKLCAECAKKEIKFKEDPNTKDESWRGRLDETVPYARARIVGCQYFFEKYPNGIRGDPFKPVVETKVTEPVTIAPKTLPVKAEWENFKHEGYEHIRNLKTGYCYRRDILKLSTEDNAIEEQYAGMWVNGKLDSTIPYDA